MTALHRDYGDKIQIVFRNYPLDKSCNVSMQSKMHEFACSAAILARCAGQYGKFWEYFRTVYANQEKISDANLKAWGLQIGLTQEQMDTCLASPDILAKIKDDVSLGNRLGVNATPTLFLNGQKIIGDKGINDIKRRIDDNLN
jgi:protein-disulfide isomerase